MFEQLKKDIVVESALSGGPGGQNVNKRKTKAVARLDVLGSAVLSDEDKTTLREKLKLTVEGHLVVHVSEARSGPRNREIAIERLLDRVRMALTPETPRGKTNVPTREKRHRLDEKRRRGVLKQSRQVPTKGEY